MTKKQWYEQLFENYGSKYDQESFTQGTLGECDFIEQEIAINKKIRILDIGCGTGRHAIELAKRGYKITGIDLSENQLTHARRKASEAGFEIDFRHMDARQLTFDKEFDLAIMICEGGFPLMETDEMNFEILQGAARALRENGKFIFTTLNGLFPISNSINQFHGDTSESDAASYHSSSFDLMTFRDHNTTKLTDDSGNETEMECTERYYIPSEITWLLKSLGFKKIDIYGAALGAFSRADVLKSTDFEMLVIAEK